MTTVANTLKRVEKIEVRQSTGRIASIVNLSGCRDPTIEAARQVARMGARRTRQQTRRYLHYFAPALTVEEWEARTDHLRGESLS